MSHLPFTLERIMTADIGTVKKARLFAYRTYKQLRDDYRYSGHPSHAASEAIRLAGIKFGIGYGCEGFCWDCGRDGISYLNMGDTYATTVLFDSRTGRFTVSCYGDIVEQLERDGIELD